MINLYNGDCLEVLKTIPDQSVNLVLTDPPYNVSVTRQENGKTIKEAWDKIDGYIDWCIQWLTECQRVLKPNGVLYLFHNDMAQIAELMEAIRRRTNLVFVSFCIWDKGDSYRAQSWHQRDPEGKTALRSWFNVCEYCLHFFNAPADAEAGWKHTGLDRINSNPECYKELKDWVAAEQKRLGLSDQDIARKYTEITGKKPHMLRHYFKDSQFEIPTRVVWESVYMPLGFGKSYEELRKSYEELRNVHNVDNMHCNVWHIPPIPSNGRYHVCQKPVELLERLICVSSNEGGLVLDCFAGSGSTGVACINTGREFIGIEKDPKYYEVARKRLEDAESQIRLF